MQKMTVDFYAVKFDESADITCNTAYN